MAPFSTALVLLVAATVLWSAAAMGQSPRACGKHSNVLNHLERVYGEVPVASGVTSGGGIAELLTTKDRDTWTIVVTSHHGVTCMVIAGQGWRDQEETEAEGDPL